MTAPHVSHRQHDNNRKLDWLFVNSTRFFAFLVFSMLIAILISLVYGSWPTIQKFGFSFLFTSEWNPVTEEFGALIPIYGTLITSAIALIIAVPVSFGIAIFLTELSPIWLRRPLGTAVELLAGIPSIIYGMWGLFVLAPVLSEGADINIDLNLLDIPLKFHLITIPPIQPWITDTTARIPLIGSIFEGPPIGIGMFTAGLVLSIMIIPYIASVMRDVFQIVPSVLKESAYGLGATTWEVVWNVVLPYTKVGVIGGIMLGLGRALGETMAVTFVIGNAHLFSPSLFMPGTSITATIANEFTEADGILHTSALLELGLVLFFITFLVLALSKLLLLQLSKGEGGKS